MNDTERLRDKLSKLAAPLDDTGNGPRKLQGGGSGGLHGAIFGEIDETILARKVRFENDRGETLIIEVANRRVLCLSGDGACPPLSRGDASLLAQIKSRFDEFVKDAEYLLVQTASPECAMGAADVGISTDSLAQLWSGDFGNTPVVVVEFVDLCSDLTTAYLQIPKSGEQVSHGDNAAVKRLQALAKNNISPLRNASAVQPQDRPGGALLVVGSAQVNSKSVVYAKDASAEAFMLIDSGNIPEIYASWQKAGG